MQTLGDVITWTMALVGAIVIPYLIIRAWIFPHARTIAAAIARAYQSVRHYFMSSEPREESEIQPGDGRSQQPNSNGNHPIVRSNNGDNRQVSVNGGDAYGLSAEGLEAVRFQAKAEAIADLLQKGLLTNQATAIETVYHCSRTSSKRPDTPYQKARQLIEQLVNPRPVFYDDLRARIAAEVQAEEEHEAVQR